MSDFLRFFDSKKEDGPWKLEIYYSSVMDWCIDIKYDISHPRGGEYIVHSQDHDIELAFAKAHVLFKAWLRENEGGY